MPSFETPSIADIAPNRVRMKFWGDAFKRNIGENGITAPQIYLVTPNVRNPDLDPSKIEGPTRPLTEQEEFMRYHLTNFFKEEPVGQFQGQSILCPNTLLGYGHLVQQNTVMNYAVSLLGLSSYYYDPLTLMPDIKAWPFKRIQEFIRTYQTKEDIAGFLESITADNTVGLQEQINRKASQVLFKIALSGSGIYEQDQGFISRMSRGIAKKITNNEALSVKIIQGIMLGEIYSAERQISEVNKRLIKGLAPIAAVTAHPIMTRSIDGIRDFYTLALNPDPGFIDNVAQFRSDADQAEQGVIETMGITMPFAPSPLLGKEVGAVYANPLDEFNEVLKKISPNVNAVTIGTLSESVSPEAAIAKWSLPTRTVLLAANGSGSNFAQIDRALAEFIEARKQGIASSYKLIIFLGHHQENLPPVVREYLTQKRLTNSETAQYLDDIEFVQAKNPLEAAALKDDCSKRSHVEFRSPGENVLDDGNKACAPFCSLSNAVNEPRNLIYAMEHGAGMPANYPPFNKEFYDEYFATLPKFQSPLLKGYFEHAHDNFISFLDEIFGNQGNGEFATGSLAERVAINGFINLNPHAALHALLILFQMMLNHRDQEVDVRDDQIAAINKYMEEQVKAPSRQIRKEQMTAAGFKWDEGFKQD